MSDNGYIAAPGGSKILLEMESIEDTFGNVVVRHEYPNVNGADLERTGQTPRTVKMRAFFWDEPGHVGYDNHKALINLLDVSEFLELTHPVYGLIKGMAEQIVVRHDDSDRYAEVDFTFVQQLRESTVAVQVVDVAAAMEGRFLEALEAELERIRSAGRMEIGAEFDEIEEVDLEEIEDENLLDQFTGLGRDAWNYVKKVDTAVRTMEGFLLEVTAPVNALISTVDFATNLPGRLMGSMARCIERFATLGEKLVDSPFRFMDSFKGGLLLLENALPDFSSHVKAVGAARACLALGDIFSSDDQARRGNDAIAVSPPFDAKGSRIPAASPDRVISVVEMENAAAAVRSWVQEAVDLDRSRTELKVMARDLVVHMSEVKVQRENLVTVDIEQAMPLHLVCLKYGLPYSDAERLLTVNRIRRPNFTRGEVLVYG